ncbi:hypothetical protein [Hymenobacter sp. PAMC 26628]|uniref:hypothetical protein n=1 Tax=Hymenobacter sp. PAMC 26628 TaxID=1484118 RepID=UPI000B0A8968|nr:hypothetical protein [Hymenobacter sp. PAMC 26628]
MQKLLLLLVVLVGALLPAQARAQAAPGTDTILRLDGQEIQGRVVTLTPTVLRYLPAAPAAPDTLALPVAEVFLVRYANGTKEVLHPEAAAGGPADLLPGLDAGQRVGLGRRDAAAHYNQHGPYWGTLGTTLYAGPVFGLVPAAIISSIDVKARNFQSPQPALLADADYQRGYQQQANRTKRQRAWAGYGTGAGVWVVLVAVLLTAAASHL